MIVLDTNVLSEPLRRHPDPAVLAWLAAVAEPTAVTSVSVGELLTGVRRLPDGRRRDDLHGAIEEVLDEFGTRVLPYDARAAPRYAVMQQRRREAGRPLSTEDGMIAAICAAHDAVLATRNTADFELLGIAVTNPWEDVGSR
ncbi:ribonuclease VapC [Actinomycetota bacterium]|nr:ribonuclease VapC [Actinomycetota bacterium]